jgi:hypothetical protein
MRTRTFALTLILAGLILPASSIIPKYPKPEPNYDTATVIDVTARITDVWEIAPYMPLEGIHLMVKSEFETLEVYVGPSDFVKAFGVTLAKGDRIEVIGSRVKTGSGDIVLASEIHKFGRHADTLLLRDEKDGTPFWRN